MTEPDLATTRRALHAVAELVLAGPQHRACGDIRLFVSPGGFRTAAEPDLRVERGALVTAASRVSIDGATARELGAAVGVEAGEPVDVYGEGSGASVDERLNIDQEALDRIVGAYELGDAALRQHAPDEEPILWPEHFDVGIRVDDINYGVSPGDGFLDEPYAYVGVDPVPADPYWNAPFGRTALMTQFASPEQLVEFFADGRARIASTR